MYKVLLICVLLLATNAINVKKNHKNVHGHKKHHEKTLNHKIGFHSASFELINVGEADYHLDEKVSKHWDEVTKKFIEKDDSSATSFVETEAEEMKSVLGEVIDLSGETGVIGYTITDEQGNVIESESGPQLAEKMRAAMQSLYESEEKTSSFLQQDALVDDEQPQLVDQATEKLKNDIEQIKKDEQDAAQQ